MKKILLSLLLFCGLLAPVFALTDICDITIGPDSKAAAFSNGENVTIMMDYTTLLRRLWVPVRFRFGSAGVHNFTFSSNTAATSLLLNENFTTSFQYNVTYPGGVRIFIRPFSNGALTPGYGASGSGLYTGSGSTSANFTISSGKNVHVDALRVQVLSADQSVTVDEFFIPANVYFSTKSQSSCL